MNYKSPILELGNVLITSIVVDLSDQQAVELQSNIVNAIKDKDSLGVIVDISALDTVDSFMARVINDTAKAIKLLGAEVIICGIQPYVAMTLVEMGGGFFDVSSTFNLEQALNSIKRKIRDAI